MFGRAALMEASVTVWENSWVEFGSPMSKVLSFFLTQCPWSSTHNLGKDSPSKPSPTAAWARITTVPLHNEASHSCKATQQGLAGMHSSLHW